MNKPPCSLFLFLFKLSTFNFQLSTNMKDLFGTIGTRYLIAILNLALIFVNAKVLGVEGVGLVGLILAAVSISTMFCGILAGNTIVYFMNRYSLQAVFLPSYCWTPIGAGIACCGMAVAGLLPEGYAADIYILSILTSLVAASSRFLLGKNHIKGFNLTFILQGGLLFFVLLLLYYGLKIQNVSAYLWGMYLTNGIAFLVSLLLLLPFLKQKKEDPRKGRSLTALLKEMFAYGLWGSADNIAEILTTRLNYFLIKRFAGLGSVGLLDAGTKVSESVWHINRSIGYIEYSRVAQANDLTKQKQITLRFFKLTFCVVTFATGCILLIPEWVYTDYLFSVEFAGIRKVITGLAAGIIALACNSILSQYFIGSGKIRYSAGSSFVGLLGLLVSGYLLIPVYGVVGSAISSSIAFCAMLTFSVAIFCRKTDTRLKEFLINKEDIRFVLQKLKLK